MKEFCVRVCIENCPKRYGSSEEQIGLIVETQEAIEDEVERSVVISKKCLGVCKLIENSNFELINDAVVNVRVDIDGEGYIPGVAVVFPDNRVLPKRLSDLYK